MLKALTIFNKNGGWYTFVFWCSEPPRRRFF